MNKYAFIENVPDLSVDAYSDCFDDGEWMNLIAGFNGMDKVIIAAVEAIDPTIPVGSNGITL